MAVSCAAPGIFDRGWRGGGGGGRGSIPDFFQVLNVSYSGSLMVYFGSNFFLGGGGGRMGAGGLNANFYRNP